MGNTRQEAVEVRAHQLWEESGHVHGRHDEHWEQAEREVDAAAAEEQGEAEPASGDDISEVTKPSNRRADKR